MNIFTLSFLFMRFGCVSFGGGYVLVPLIIAELIEKRGLLTLSQFGNLISIAQVTPGPVGINTATYVGYLHSGVSGGILASIGLIIPSLVIGTLAVTFINRWKDSIAVKGVMQGVRPAALGLLFFAVFQFLGMSVFTTPIPWKNIFQTLTGAGSGIPADFRLSIGGLVICCVSILLMWKTKISTTLPIILSAVAGALICR